jgi:hypothetical protein
VSDEKNKIVIGPGSRAVKNVIIKENVTKNISNLPSSTDLAINVPFSFWLEQDMKNELGYFPRQIKKNALEFQNAKNVLNKRYKKNTSVYFSKKKTELTCNTLLKAEKNILKTTKKYARLRNNNRITSNILRAVVQKNRTKKKIKDLEKKAFFLSRYLYYMLTFFRYTTFFSKILMDFRGRLY